MLKSSLQTFHFSTTSVDIFIPDSPDQLTHSHSAYWAKVWPAAIGLCRFLEGNLHLINNKKILELAAGLGLPSLLAAKYATEVYLSDLEPQAVELMRLSVTLNAYTNVQCGVIDWNNIGNVIIPDVLLLSDINYEPSSFSALLFVIHQFLNAGCTIILSTPQRLMAKAFVTQLLPFSIQQEEIITEPGIAISVFVLAQK